MSSKVEIRSKSGAQTTAMFARALAKCLTLVAAFVATASAQSPSTEPLIQSSNVTYLGAFALPSWANGATYGSSFFEYGGHALTFYRDPSTGKQTLYMEGDAQMAGNVAQVAIPSTLVNSTNWSSLPMATVLQNFVQLNSDPDPTSCVGNPAFMYGLLAYQGRLIMNAACSYGGAQTTSTSVGSLTLSASSQNAFYGFAPNVIAPPRALAGPMILIPPEWQSAFGGPAMTGQCCISVTGTTSSGPSMTVFDPATVGVTNPIPGNTVLFYPLSNPACGTPTVGSTTCSAEQSNIYNLTTVYGGAAWPTGTRSILFVTATGIGPYCYGSASDCNDPYLTQVLAAHALCGDRAERHAVQPNRHDQGRRL
jgi:hypothetical protein